MTNELHPGEFVDDFVSGGPKNYAYRVVNRTDTTKTPKIVCKVRGINLNYSASQLVNIDVIRDMILNRRPDEVVTVHTDRKIKSKRKEGRVQILSEAEDKIYRVSFFKRRRLHDNK
jgi:dephospho-CoA kinase